MLDRRHHQSHMRLHVCVKEEGAGGLAEQPGPRPLQAAWHGSHSRLAGRRFHWKHQEDEGIKLHLGSPFLIILACMGEAHMGGGGGGDRTYLCLGSLIFGSSLLSA